MRSSARAPLLAAAAVAAGLLAQVSGQDTSSASAQQFSPVDCGGHYASSCDECPQGNSWSWCNGQCVWVNGKGCLDKQPQWVLVDNTVKEVEAVKTPSRWSWILMMQYFPLMCLVGVIMFFYAMIYKVKVVNQLPDRIDDRDGDGQFEEPFGICDCVSKPNTCLFVCCCLPVVAAKNYQAAKVMSFWPSCILCFIGIYSPFYCVAAVVRTMLSSKLKKNLNYSSEILVEFFLSLCCMPCAIGRDSLEVDDALHVDIKCAFQVESTWTPMEAVKGIETRGCCSCGGGGCTGRGCDGGCGCKPKEVGP